MRTAHGTHTHTDIKTHIDIKTHMHTHLIKYEVPSDSKRTLNKNGKARSNSARGSFFMNFALMPSKKAEFIFCR